MKKICLIIAVFSIIFMYNMVTAETISNPLEFTEKEITEDNKDLKYTIKALYPQLVNYEDKNTEKQFNDKIYSAVNKDIAAFQEDMRNYYSDSPGGLGNFYDLTYELINKDDNFISIRFLIDVYTGGAHGAHYFWSFNYDLPAGKELKLADLFTPSSDYLKIISDYSIEDLKRQTEGNGYEPNMEWIKKGAGPEEINYECFNLTREGLIIMFNEYQVGSYVEGSKEVIIPYSELKDIINPEGPGGKYI